MLDPIDGTRGFLKGSDALYVVGFTSFDALNMCISSEILTLPTSDSCFDYI